MPCLCALNIDALSASMGIFVPRAVLAVIRLASCWETALLTYDHAGELHFCMCEGPCASAAHGPLHVLPLTSCTNNISILPEKYSTSHAHLLCSTSDWTWNIAVGVNLLLLFSLTHAHALDNWVQTGPVCVHCLEEGPSGPNTRYLHHCLKGLQLHVVVLLKRPAQSPM